LLAGVIRVLHGFGTILNLVVYLVNPAVPTPAMVPTVAVHLVEVAVAQPSCVDGFVEDVIPVVQRPYVRSIPVRTCAVVAPANRWRIVVSVSSPATGKPVVGHLEISAGTSAATAHHLLDSREGTGVVTTPTFAGGGRRCATWWVAYPSTHVRHPTWYATPLGCFNR
jgi:hypothetical protein